MAKSKPFPDDLSGIRNKLVDLAKDISEIKKQLQRPSVWSFAYWEDHKAKLTIVLFALSGFWFVFTLVLDSRIDSRIKSATSPIQQQLEKIGGDLKPLAGTVSVLQTQIAAQRYAKLPPKELKSHKEELNQLRTKLVSLPPTSQEYWQTSFQVITLLSQAVSYVQSPTKHSEVSDSSNIKITKGGVVVLKGKIEDSLFEQTIIQFDPSLTLKNVTFINCVFVFPATTTPSKPLEDIGKTLLASDLSKVTLNIS